MPRLTVANKPCHRQLETAMRLNICHFITAGHSTSQSFLARMSFALRILPKVDEKLFITLLGLRLLTHTITWKDSFKYDLLAFVQSPTTCSFSIDQPCGISEDPEKEKIMPVLKGLMDNGKCRPESAQWKSQGLWVIERIRAGCLIQPQRPPKGNALGGRGLSHLQIPKK